MFGELFHIGEQNMKQRTPKTEIKSKWRGVSFHSHSYQWRAQIRIGGKVTHLGCFDEEADAAQSYNFAADRFHGDKAVFNNSDENQNQGEII